MAEHLREQTIPEEMVAMADYYLRGVMTTSSWVAVRVTSKLSACATAMGMSWRGMAAVPVTSARFIRLRSIFSVPLDRIAFEGALGRLPLRLQLLTDDLADGVRQ